jgi:hypothetical protein
MSDLTEALAIAQGEHRQALEWFAENAGSVVPWSVIKAQTEKGFRLVNQAKGIYKPRYGDYALSVRQTLDSPYADKEVTRRPDGSWLYPYFQENPDPQQRDREATNRGLVKCMEDGMPVGVLMQTKPKPGVEYEILGLAAVTQWQNGYFILEGFSDVGNSSFRRTGADAAYDRARAATIAGADFNLEEIADQRVRQIVEAVQRKGQSKFRNKLLAAYGGKCQVTGCDAAEALEAAHISPYMGELTNHVQNGLLLRADLHTLFDLGLLAIDPATMRIVLSERLRGTHYGELSGRQCELDPGFRTIG